MTPETTTRLRNAFARVALEHVRDAETLTTGTPIGLPFSSMTEEDWRTAVRLWREHASAILDTVPPRDCPACGSSRSRFLFLSYDAHPFHECEECGCWFEPKAITEEVFERFFERCPAARALATSMMVARDDEQRREADMARIGGYLDDLRPLLAVRDTPAYLDVGCGVGHSLRAGQARGFRVRGIEASTSAVALAVAAGLPATQPGYVSDEGRYDLISFWETMEHLHDPLGALESYLPLLAADGLVALTVPNLNALATRVLRESCAWVHGGYNTSGHLNLFGPASIERLLQRAGLAVLYTESDYSADPIELAAYLAGQGVGAFAALGGDSVATLPEAVVQLLRNVWPGVALVERLVVQAPILRVVACRPDRARELAPQVEARRVERRAALVHEAQRLIEQEPDYRAISESQQLEINRRDELLRNAATASQAEITLRDREIARRDRTLRETVAAMQREIERRDAELKRRDAEIQRRDAEIERRGAEIERRDAEIKRRDGEIEGWSSEIKRRDEGLRTATSFLQGEIDRRDRLLAEARERFEHTINGRWLAARQRVARLLRRRA